MSKSVSDVLWTEKYRPDSLEALALPHEDREFLESCLDRDEIPHLLLEGPAGCGKTSLAYILANELAAEKLVLNASKERGIDVIRDRVANFAKGMFGEGLNIVILDEADGLTQDGQQAIRNLMETNAGQTRFILTANFPHQIIDPIRSRCHEIEMARLKVRDRFEVLVDVLNAEDVQYDPEDALAYAESYTDLRRMLNAAQRVVLQVGTLAPPQKNEISGEKVLNLIHEDRWESLVDIAKTPGTNHQKLLIDMFWDVPNDFPKVASVRYEIAKAVNESTYAPDDVVHWLGTCAGLIKEIQ